MVEPRDGRMMVGWTDGRMVAPRGRPAVIVISSGSSDGPDDANAVRNGPGYFAPLPDHVGEAFDPDADDLYGPTVSDGFGSHGGYDRDELSGADGEEGSGRRDPEVSADSDESVDSTDSDVTIVEPQVPDDEDEDSPKLSEADRIARLFAEHSPEAIAALQVLLLGLDESNIDDIVGRFNAEFPNTEFVAQLVLTVAGARRDAAVLIQFMNKLSETRGYSALAAEVAALHVGQSEDLEGVAAAIVTAVMHVGQGEAARTATEGRRARLKALLLKEVEREVRSVLDSSPFCSGVRSAAAVLHRLWGNVPDPVAALRASVAKPGTRFGVVMALMTADTTGSNAAVRQAIDRLSDSRIAVGAVVAAVETLMEAGLQEEDVAPVVQGALYEAVGHLRQEVADLKSLIDVARGFTALDCVRERDGSAVQCFAEQWRQHRGLWDPEAINPMALAIIAEDVGELGTLIGGRRAADIKIDAGGLPPEIRRPRGRVGLLDIAAAVGGAGLRYMLEFFQLTPTIKTLSQAVSSGNAEAIRMIWDRLDEEIRDRHLAQVARVAVDFHQVDVASWLLVGARPSAIRAARAFATKARAFDMLLRLPAAVSAPGMKGLLEECASELGQAGVALSAPVLKFDWTDAHDDDLFESEMAGKAPTLLIAEDDQRNVFGALIRIPWAKNPPSPLPTGTFLFFMGTGETELQCFNAVVAPRLEASRRCLRVGELTLKRTGKSEFICRCDPKRACTREPEQFPRIKGKAVEWELWAL